MKKLALALLIATLATGASGHSRVETTTPMDGVTLDMAPAQISLNFSKDIRLTRVDLIHQASPSVVMELGEQTGFGRAFTMPLLDKGQGVYRVDWRGLGQDGHAMKGSFSFVVE